MAASANPSGNQEGSNHGVNPPTNNGNSVAEHSVQTQAALRHNPGLSVEWTADEQSILEELLVKYASESSVSRYAKIAMQLEDKTVRDVALRCRWMTKKENGKRRKEDHNLARRNKDKKEKALDSSAKTSSHLTRPSGPSYAPPIIPADDDGISYKAIGGAMGQLLEKNAQMFNQISANFANYQIHENINLFCQVRDNINKIMNNMNDTPEIMKQMPPLVKINEELALAAGLPPMPPSSHHMKP